MSIAQGTILAVAGGLAWYVFFWRGNQILLARIFRISQAIAWKVFSFPAFLILWTVRALAIGYLAYLVTVFVLNFPRIEEFHDLWVIVTVRPSSMGMRGLLGVLVGVIFAGWIFCGGQEDQRSIRPEKGHREIGVGYAAAMYAEMRLTSVTVKGERLSAIDEARKARRARKGPT